MAQAPVLVLLLAGGLMALGSHQATTLPRLVGLLPMAWCSALGVLRVTRRARAVAIVAAVATWVGSWGFLALAVPLVVIADRHAGSIATAVRHGLVRRRKDEAPSDPVAIRQAAVSDQAVDRHRVAGAEVADCRQLGLPVPVVLIPAWLFLHNNRLDPAHEAGAVRLAGVSAGVIAMAVLADGLVKRRPPWPWIRSLPWSAWGSSGV